MKTKLAGMGGAPAQTFVDDVFSTYLYTGNGSTQTITNGIDLAGKGGLVWSKDRGQANNNVLQDTVRGVASVLSSNFSAGDLGYTNNITAFGSTGYSISNGSEVNRSTGPYASWTFRKAAKFFDVVTYTGNGASNRAITHSLGIEPGMIIVKAVNGNSNWAVWHKRSIIEGDTRVSLYLNNTSTWGPALFGSTQPTSTDFYVFGTSNDLNISGQTYVAYLFAHDTAADGIIQCGSYTTNGSGVITAPVNLGWEPQYVLYKRVDAARDWSVVDSMRGNAVANGTQNFLHPNLSDAETSSYGEPSPLATGFTVTASTASSTYIYMAIRRPNKPPTSGTQVFSPQIATGNGTSNTITTNFPVDMVIDAPRDQGGTSRYAFDRLRGNGNWLVPNNTSAEFASGSTLINFANNTGFINANWGAVSGASYVDWSFKRAPGFFDEVCYTGTGVDRTVNHNLTVAPELINVKARSSSGNYWKIYFGNITTALFLNTNDAAIGAGGTWGTTAPTSTVFWVGGSYGDVNGNGKTYVAYLFATLAGISKIGSYTGNGTGQAIACGFSAGARFVLIKRTDAAGDWYTFDSARGLTSGSSPYLLLNSTAAETTGNNGVYQSTGGFTLGATAITTTNILGASYIYLSVA